MANIRFVAKEEKSSTPLMTQQEYLDAGGEKCPRCRSENICRGVIGIYELYQRVQCMDCEARWKASYALTGYVPLIHIGIEVDL